MKKPAGVVFARAYALSVSAGTVGFEGGTKGEEKKSYGCDDLGYGMCMHEGKANRGGSGDMQE